MWVAIIIINKTSTTDYLVLTTCSRLSTSKLWSLQFTYRVSIFCFKDGKQPILFFFCTYCTLNRAFSPHFVFLLFKLCYLQHNNLSNIPWRELIRFLREHKPVGKQP